jgi:hypothetical protein
MWVRRIVRRIGWTSSPLCRTSDRIEAWATTALVVVILSIGPWVDDGGSQSAPPAQRSPRADATAAAVLAWCVLTGGFVGVRQTFRSMLNRRRLRSWQAEWLAVEPRWSRR